MKLKLLPFIVAPLLAIAPLSSHADTHSTDNSSILLFKMLHDKGAINDQEYAQLLAKAKAEQAATITLNDGHLKIKSADEKFEMKLGGRIMADYAFINNDVENKANASEMRRVRLFAAGTMLTEWQYKAQFDFADNKTTIKDLYIRYKGWKTATITIGNHDAPFGLEQLTSSKYITFIERSIASDAFSIGRQNGLSLATGGDHWSFVTMAHMTGVNANNSKQNEDYGYGMRASYAPIAEKTRALHLGVAIHHQKYRAKGGAEKQLSLRPEVHTASTIFKSNKDKFDSNNTYGLELAAVFGPLSFQSEVARRNYNAVATRQDQSLNSWYAYTSYFITGESRIYKAKTASFQRIKPKNTNGAWEVALRYSDLDLEDHGIGTQGNITTLGLNWYTSPSIRFMTNYNTTNVKGTDKNFNAVHFRGQIDF